MTPAAAYPGAPDRDVNRVVREPLEGDQAAVAAERRTAGDDSGCRLAGNRARQNLILRPWRGELGVFGIAGKPRTVFAQHAGLMCRAEQGIVERGEIGARHRDDDNPPKAAVGRVPALADGEVRLVVASVEAAGAQSPDESLDPGVAERPKILAPGM